VVTAALVISQIFAHIFYVENKIFTQIFPNIAGGRSCTGFPEAKAKRSSLFFSNFFSRKRIMSLLHRVQRAAESRIGRRPQIRVWFGHCSARDYVVPAPGRGLRATGKVQGADDSRRRRRGANAATRGNAAGCSGNGGAASVKRVSATGARHAGDVFRCRVKRSAQTASRRSEQRAELGSEFWIDGRRRATDVGFHQMWPATGHAFGTCFTGCSEQKNTHRSLSHDEA
jgi:hypothetical protein